MGLVGVRMPRRALRVRMRVHGRDHVGSVCRRGAGGCRVGGLRGRCARRLLEFALEFPQAALRSSEGVERRGHPPLR